MAGVWMIRGDYLENCSCEVLCPCLPSHLEARPTEGYCTVVMAFHVEEGQFNGLSLNGLSTALAMRSPAEMGKGNWTVAPYIDVKANEPQRKALVEIFTGSVGGPITRISPLFGKILEPKFVRIQYSRTPRQRSVIIPGVMDISVEGIKGRGEEEMWIENAPHPASSRLAFARSKRGTYADHGWKWEMTNRNGHYAPIEWRSS